MIRNLSRTSLLLGGMPTEWEVPSCRLILLGRALRLLSDEPSDRVELTELEEVDLYIFLRRHDRELTDSLESVRSRLERYLYQRMSIAEMEELESRIAE